MDFDAADIIDGESFLAKLRNNFDHNDIRDDLLVEAQAAVTLAYYGFEVTMRDTPDLQLRVGETLVYAEVKRFREKEKDRIDDARLEEAGRQGRLVQYGGPVEEGRDAWDQVVDVVAKKCRQYSLKAPLLLIIRSDSGHCIEDDEVMTAANIINERIWKRESNEFDMLAGLLLFARWGTIYFHQIFGRSATLPDEMVENLKKVRKRYILP